MLAPQPRYDVFLSYDHADSDAVEDLGRILLSKFAFKVWLDKWMCVPGESWQQAIAKGLNETATCAVCIGKKTTRGWFRQEIERALERQSIDVRYRVIPIILPNAPDDILEYLPAFVGLRTWVDFRPGHLDSRALHLLQHGVKGTPPGPWPAIPARTIAEDATLEQVERDLQALDRIRALLHENVLIETQRRIVDRRFQ